MPSWLSGIFVEWAPILTSGEHHLRWRRSQTTSTLRYPISSRNTPPQSTMDGMKPLPITHCLLPKAHLPMFIVAIYWLSPIIAYHPFGFTHCLSPIAFYPLRITRFEPLALPLVPNSLNHCSVQCLFIVSVPKQYV
jgi:hypothetical protein